MIKWRSFHETGDTAILNKVESKYGVKLPDGYIRLALMYDGGVPDKKLFLAGQKDRVFQRLITIQENKHPNLLDATDWVDANEQLIPFALDPFGNVICFSYKSGPAPSVVYLETETNTVYSVSQSFSDFLNSLRTL